MDVVIADSEDKDKKEQEFLTDYELAQALHIIEMNEMNEDKKKKQALLSPLTGEELVGIYDTIEDKDKDKQPHASSTFKGKDRSSMQISADEKMALALNMAGNEGVDIDTLTDEDMAHYLAKLEVEDISSDESDYNELNTSQLKELDHLQRKMQRGEHLTRQEVARAFGHLDNVNKTEGASPWEDSDSSIDVGTPSPKRSRKKR